jgi:DNA modification methylase
VLPEDTPAEKLKEIVIKDNGTFGAWDFDLLANQWDDLPLATWGVPAWDGEEKEAEPEAKEDDFDEETDEIHVRCKKGDIWQLGDHRLMCGDSTDLEAVKKLTGGGQIDMLLTDPPYNVDYSSKNEYLTEIDKANRVLTAIKGDKMTTTGYRKLLEDAFLAAKEVLKAGGAFYVWSALGHEMTNVAHALDSVGLVFRQQIIWAKNSLVLGRMDYQCKHEPCYYGWKDGAHFFRDTRSETTVIPDAAELDLKKMKKEEMYDLLKKILSDDTPTTLIREDKPMVSDLHPTMKPVRLFGRLITNSSRPGETVLDLFGGSGTTIIAAEQLGRRCCMMEYDPHYCDVILSRWEKMTGRQAVRIMG